jgi:catechol 2,3-dioxygenase-like lactoylglutathione lyase family enzyme
MKLNHINLTVTDVPETVKFLEKYFELKERRFVSWRMNARTQFYHAENLTRL